MDLPGWLGYEVGNRFTERSNATIERQDQYWRIKTEYSIVDTDLLVDRWTTVG